MPEFESQPEFELERAIPAGVDAVAVPVPVGGLEATGVAGFLAAQGFEGKLGQVAVLPGDQGDEPGPDVVHVGVGEATEVDASGLRTAAACALRAAGRRSSLALRLLDAVVDGDDRAVCAQAIVEGAALAAYNYRRSSRAPAPGAPARIVLVGRGNRVAAAVERGARVAKGVALARDLVNTPGGDLTPENLAEIAVDVAERDDLAVKVMDEEAIADAGMGGLLGVNRGSLRPPRFVEIVYEPDEPRGSLAFVGKGITFDSGGLSLKSSEAMETMKMDMAGAAAVIGAFSSMRAVAPRCRVTGYIPATDNMTGGDATRPGDVLEIRDGTTVEVLNTDAEGRLILADALALAVEAQPDAIVDLATLTGAVTVALGERIAGLMGNDDAWVEQVRRAAESAGERVWELPLPADYGKRIESDVADLRNISRSKSAGTITAGLFLSRFVPRGIPWAHLDIAGTAWWGDKPEGEFSRGGTGWGVRTLLELAGGFRRPPRRR